MTISDAVRARVRKRADYACEFCGVREVDSGGELTMDHYQPKFKGGNDDLDNLLYCCQRCNQYKLDYWPVRAGDLPLWNPRQNNASKHFIELDDGKLYPLTSIGAFTINRLRLNRPPLIAHRIRERQLAEDARRLARQQEAVRLLENLNRQFSALVEEQQRLLEELGELLRFLLGSRK